MSVQSSIPFTLARRDYYDVPERLADEDSRFAANRRRVPNGWLRQDVGLSVALSPNHSDLPNQGWKIHVSTTLSQAHETLDRVWQYCVGNQIAFKYLRSRAAVLAFNSKYWPRSASGKFITIYPANEGQFTTTLIELDDRLSAFPGPYILSDVRYRGGPLFARYGAFKPMWRTGHNGIRVPAIKSPVDGLIPDERTPRFVPPAFAAIPQVLLPYVRARSTSLDDCGYEFDTALHYSNGGGVYLGRAKSTGTEVLIKEARPLAGLDDRENDAVWRLGHEHEVLLKLQGLGCVPRVIDRFVLWEHHFLVIEVINGRTLLDEIIHRYPLVHPDPTEAELAEYVNWADRLFERLESAVASIHELGVSIVDLHPSNIMVKPSGELVFVDFEGATSLTDTSGRAFGAPGFTAPSDLAGEAGDRYAMACVRLMLLMPMVPILSLEPSKASTLLSAARYNLPVNDSVIISLERDLAANPAIGQESDPAAPLFSVGLDHWPSVRAGLIAGILESATPLRDDRLFPGDPLQFSQGGATLAYGAAGVLLALSQAGEEIPGALTQWLCDAALRRDASHGLGLYNGRHGIAYVLWAIGRYDQALEAVREASLDALPTDLSLFSGQAGAALNLLYFGVTAGDERLVSKALGITETIAQTLHEGSGQLDRLDAGLMSGAAGLALLMLRAYESTDDRRFLDAADTALKLDLKSGRELEDGTYHILSGSKYLLYLDGGSIGVGLVLARFLLHRDVPEYSRLLLKIRLACRTAFVYQPGLFQGRAGLIALLAESPSGEDLAFAKVQAGRLAWHAVMRGGSLLFPGAGLTKLSVDLATGSAGILMALRALNDGKPVGLPFLGPWPASVA